MSDQYINLLKTPYRGLIPYSEEDAQFFFGREKDRKNIIANLQGSPLTVLYGSSGVGKSSVLRAGVVFNLQQQAKQNLQNFGKPEFAVVVFNSWRDNPLGELMQKIETDIRTIFPKENAHIESSCNIVQERVIFSRFLLARKELYRLISPLISCLMSLLFAEFLKTAAELTGDEEVNGILFIILDQFEEYFLYHPDEEGDGTFFAEFSRVVNRPDVNFLISLREDSLAQLDRFKARIPSLFNNYLRLKHLDAESAHEAIVKPTKKYNELFPNEQPVSIEEDLTKAVIDQVSQVLKKGNGLGGLEKLKSQIETPYLQLVMTRIWEEEMNAGSRRLQLKTFLKLGGAEKIVEQHLNDEIELLENEQGTAAVEAMVTVFQYLVTPSGNKIAYPVSDLAKNTELDEREIRNVLETLTQRGRILRRVGSLPNTPDVERYEIFHDVLAEPILNWRKQYSDAKERQQAIKEHQTIIEEKEQRISKLKQIKDVLQGIGAGAILMGAGLLAGQFVFWKQAKIEETGRVGKEVLFELDTSSQLTALEKFMMAQQNWDKKSFIKDSLGSLKFFFDELFRKELPNMPELNGTLQEILANIRELNQFQVSNQEVRGVSFSPDGQILASASEDATISLWDLQGNPIGDPLEGHKGAVRSVSFSPGGDILASASADGTIRLWDLQGNPISNPLEGHKKEVWSVSFSPDGDILASASADGTVRLWDLRGNPIGDPLEGHKDPIGTLSRIRSVSFSPDGQILASASEDGSIRLWDLKGKMIRELIRDDENRSPFYSVSFSPDGKQLASASKDGTIIIWDLQGKILDELTDHNTPIWSVSFSPDGKQLASALQDGTIRLWARLNQKWTESTVLQGHKGSVYSVSFSSDGRHLVSSSADKTVRLWDVNSKQLLPKFIGKDKIWSISYIQPERQQLLIGSNDGTIRLWNPIKINNEIYTNTQESAHKSAVISLSTSSDGQYFASGYTDGIVRLWGLQDNKLRELIKPISAHKDWVWGISFSPDGQQLATSSSDGYVRLWDLKGNLIDEFLNKEPVWSVRFSPNGQHLAIASADGNIGLCELQGNKLTCAEKLKAHDSSVWSISFSPDGNQLASASADGTFSLWDLQNNSRKKFTVKNPDDDELVEVYSISFSQDGKKLATGSGDGNVYLWDLQGKQLAKFPGQGEVRSLSFSAHDKYLAIGSEDGTVKLRLTEDFERLHADQGCNWLNKYYLVTPSQQQNKLTICQDN